ncbi:MAG: hypothetical protein K8Q97_04665 [Candidatus Andersenbacteria bacterium]|nr:hypothetical protein [Candidatus Andersenbacteria bacterium]
MFRGLIIKESLSDQSFWEQLKITKEETWDIENSTEGQPSVWNVAWFEIKDSGAEIFSKELSKALHVGKWYVDLTSETEKIIVFPNQIYRYKKGDVLERSKAEEFGLGIGIPKSQLDWKEA